MNRQLAIIGKDNLSNSLLASYIESRTGYLCQIIEHLQHPEFSRLQSLPHCLLLIDASQFDDQQLHAFLKQNAPVLNHDMQVALFNIAPQHDSDELAQKNCIKGIFTEDISHEQFIRGIESIFEGELWLSRKLLSRLVKNIRHHKQSNQPDFGLTRRETEIIKLIAIGSRNRDIADILCLSTHTVKTHIYHIYKKIKVDNRMQAAKWANQYWNIGNGNYE